MSLYSSVGLREGAIKGWGTGPAGEVWRERKRERREEREQHRGKVNKDGTGRRGKDASGMVCWGLFTDAVIERERKREREEEWRGEF